MYYLLGCIFAFAIHSMYIYFILKVSNSHPKMWKSLGLVSMITITTLCKMTFEIDSPLFLAIIFISSPIFTFLSALLMQGKPWKRMMICIYYTIILIIGEAAALHIISLYFPSVDWSSGQELIPFFFYIVINFMTYTLVGFLSVAIWRMIEVRRFECFYLFFFILPVGQFIAIFNHANSRTEYRLIGISVCLAAITALFVYIIFHEKRTAIEAQLKEAKREMELEQVRYGEIERQSEELEKIRHDFNNQLASIIQLVRVGEDDTAQNIISALSYEINQAEKK